jgi:hypothetical protein
LDSVDSKNKFKHDDPNAKCMRNLKNKAFKIERGNFWYHGGHISETLTITQVQPLKWHHVVIAVSDF